MKIEAEIQNVKNILVNDEKFYQIPDYQRPYAWDKDNISDLLDDLTTSYLSNEAENYFCGSLVLVKNRNDNRLDVIDGQQRLTTFIILACVIRDLFFIKLEQRSADYILGSIQDKYNETNRKLKFLTSESYQVNFETSVLKKINFIETKSIEKDIKDNVYLRNAHYFKLFLGEKIKNKTIEIDSINNFIIWLYEKVVFTVITTPNPDSAIQIFNVLNNRGMPLSPIDILKSSLMHKLSQEEDRRAFRNKWETVNSNLSITDILDFDDLLTTYQYFKIAKNPEKRLDKELLDSFEQDKKNPIEIIAEIEKFAKSYIEILTQDDKYIYCLKYLQHKVYWHSILASANFLDYKHIEELKKLLVAYYYQNWIAGATVARIKQTSFNILKAIKENKHINYIKKIMHNNLTSYDTTKTYKEEIDSSYAYERKWCKAVLLLVEYFLIDESYKSFIQLTNNLQIEHILPQNPDSKSSDWAKFTTEERNLWTNSISNLTLLSMRKNIQASNYSFIEKKNVYENKDMVISSFEITRSILRHNEWTIPIMQIRQDYLLDRINSKIDIFEDKSSKPN